MTTEPAESKPAAPDQTQHPIEEPAGSKHGIDWLRFWNRVGLGVWLFVLLIRMDAWKPGLFLFFAATSFITFGVAFVNLYQANRRLKGTSLRPATLWAMLAAFFGLLANILVETYAFGNPGNGFMTHLSFLATLAALVSVLGARRPGEQAWAVLCGLFLLIGLLPMFEGVSLNRKFDVLDYLRFDSPWTYFIALVIFAGVTNYLPTRFFMASSVLGIGLMYQLRLLWSTEGRGEWRNDHWRFFSWTLAGSIILGYFVATKPRKRTTTAYSGIHDLWFPFRDAWGAAWALRVLERFNQTAIANKWPIRLHWFGIYTLEKSEAEPVNENSAEIAAQAEKTLSVFIRRFGDLEQIRKL